MRRLNFVSDLVEGIERYFYEQGIKYPRSEPTQPEHLAERYYYSLAKMIVTRPRRVHYSAEFHTTLSTLDSRYATAIEAIHSCFEEGADLSKFLSKRASDSRSNDPLLSDFGVHHFHLGTKSHPNARHVQRTDDLLFVFVQPLDAYFLDVRNHPNRNDPSDFGWCDVELLTIIDANWPEALDPFIVRGVQGTTLTDEQRMVLRTKNTNLVTQIGAKAIAPPGGGMLANGSNLKSRFQGDKLLAQVDHIEQLIEHCWDDCKGELQLAGVNVSDSAELRLVRVAESSVPRSELGAMTGYLSWSGWAIAETTSGTLIDWTFEFE